MERPLLSVIGGGAMGSALLRRWVTAGLYPAAQVALREPDPDKAKTLQQELGIRLLADLSQAGESEIVFLAVKPQVFPQVVAEMGQPSAAQLVISIMAGIPLQQLQQAFPQQRVVRTMPNTPALVGAGITAICYGPGVTPEQKEQVERLFRAVGQVVTVAESQMDAVTALSGSGPGYLAVILEALIDGGVGVGLPRPLATQLAMQTLAGTAALLQHEKLHPALLKDQVTSPGGTTIAGIQVLEEAGVRGALMRAVRAAYERSRQLQGS
ncbi:pyrroline-5-carboxylate reductase [Synechococcus sp. H55.8]|uniref:pyrroline-5-carboxylate reductase n=1 Tax=Synechococcus sp. H55.8 TaxID=2964510 RepID=UPI0039C4BA75